MPILDNLACVLECAKRLAATGTINREHAHGREPPLLELALQSLALEVFGFAHEVHHARAGNRNQSIVDHRQMVGCDNRAALSRHVIQSADSRAQTMMSNRAETFDEEPVEHLAFLPQTN